MTASPPTVLGRASPVWLVIIVLELVKEESARILVVHMGAQWSLCGGEGHLCAPLWLSQHSIILKLLEHWIPSPLARTYTIALL